MTMNSAQRLQREATQSQAVNSHARPTGRAGAEVGPIPTQVLEPTQRVSQVGLSRCCCEVLTNVLQGERVGVIWLNLTVWQK